ncbi:unnamed protein product, partial [marine sediment metagenome]
IAKYKDGIKVLKAKYFPFVTKENKKLLFIIGSELDNLTCLQRLQNVIGNDRFGHVNYQLYHESNDVSLSHREFSIAFYLIRGCSYQKIGELLNLSKRTIESYVEILKDKLSCANKNELIERIISQKLTSFIPKKFLKEFVIFKESSR